MKNKFLSAISTYSMFSPGDKVIVGLSGGADSMCLISLLSEFSDILDITVEAAHVNHMIRGAEADADENFVRTFCSLKGIPLHVLKVNIPELSKASGESTELTARKVRYDFFHSLGSDKIATAHTGSDSVETMLMNLSRGASLHGLASIPPVRGNIVRPLIYCLRTEIENYCNENNIDFVTDSTNLSDDYTRNKFRHNVIPRISEINPDFEVSALRCLRKLREDDSYLECEANRLLEEHIKGESVIEAGFISNLHLSISSRIVALFLYRFTDSDFEMKHIDYIVSHAGTDFAYNLPGNIIVAGDKNIIYIKKDIIQMVPDEISFRKNEDRVLQFAGVKFRCFSSSSVSDTEDCSAYCDYDKLGDEILIRSRNPGDKISLYKRGCTKTLKKLFNENSVPVEKRNNVAVFCDDSGIIYVHGIGVDSSRIPDKNTNKYFIIKAECK